MFTAKEVFTDRTIVKTKYKEHDGGLNFAPWYEKWLEKRRKENKEYTRPVFRLRKKQ